MVLILEDSTPYTFLYRHRRFGEIAVSVFILQHFSRFRLEDRFNSIIRNAVAYTPNTTTLFPNYFNLHIPLFNNFKFQIKKYILYNLFCFSLPSCFRSGKYFTCNFSFKYFPAIIVRRGYAVTQLVEGLRYKPEGRGFDYR